MWRSATSSQIDYAHSRAAAIGDRHYRACGQSSAGLGARIGGRPWRRWASHICPQRLEYTLQVVGQANEGLGLMYVGLILCERRFRFDRVIAVEAIRKLAAPAPDLVPVDTG